LFEERLGVRHRACRVSIAAGFLRQRASDEAFADAGGSEHENVFVLLDPRRLLRQGADHAFVQPAQLQVDRTGKFLYVSNRGHDSIAIFAIDPGKGTLTPVEHVSTQGKMPRDFSLDPSGSFFVRGQSEL
jgi:6-phosphogluconolactonase